ncbi:hypothetical protein, conserved, partial [Eimeria tenella]
RRVEVTEFRLIKSGRGAASVSLSYVDLETLKSGAQTFSVQKRLEKIEPEKTLLQVMYVDVPNGAVVLSDPNYDEVIVPLRLFGGPSVAEHLTRRLSPSQGPPWAPPGAPKAPGAPQRPFKGARQATPGDPQGPPRGLLGAPQGLLTERAFRGPSEEHAWGVPQRTLALGPPPEGPPECGAP